MNCNLQFAILQYDDADSQTLWTYRGQGKLCKAKCKKVHK